ncbi:MULTISPECIES: MBOAT family O-acyltransferase [Arenibacter]|uniref:MBOAT family O-acyltransferase n=1 Tax=Arenibacter TaxID=178469 RepID=UPI001963A68D|nr:MULTISPECIES: MBOAT family O-acyltransferase [Arenibacter]
MSWNPKYALLILTSTVITYVSGILIEKANKDGFGNKKIYVAISFISNLAILIGFKYFNFLNENFAILFNKIGIEWKLSNFDIMLPVGISFYTFQALSYTMDVYRNKIKATQHFGKYALFVSFFPQLVAGPIEKSVNLLPQFDRENKLNYDRIKDGLILMLWGFFKKLVIADRLAILVNTVFNNPHNFTGFELVIAIVFFSFQILCDFSAYTDIAIGAAKVLGYDLMKNFDRPYFSKSIPEFWRRWHISLGGWFRDYLYFPLGGSRVKKWKKNRNIMVVFLVSGIWHGASWNFLIWGFLHGIYQIIDLSITPFIFKFYRSVKINFNTVGYKLYKILLTFSLVSLAWVFFRANKLTDAIYIIKNIFVFNPEVLFGDAIYKLGLERGEFKIAIISIIVLIGFDLLERKFDILALLKNQNIILRWGLYVFFILYILFYGIYGSNEKAAFIYFQF